MLARVKKHLYRKFVRPLRTPYRPPAYREFEVTSKFANTLESLLDSYKRRQDRELFQKLLRPTDVFLIGHPKSGNTWLAYMLAKILQKDGMDQVTMASVGRYIPVVHGRDSLIRNYEELPDPRIFRSEYPVHPDLYPKTIYLLRDPRAVLVSYYHMYRVIRPDTPMGLPAFVQEYLQHGYIRSFEPLVRWDQQVLDWYDRSRHDKSVILLRYEDMVKDRGSVLQQVSRFCGIRYTEVQVAAVVEQSSFEAMKRSEEQYGAESYLAVNEQRGSFVRRGKVDAWQEEMERDVIAQVEAAFAPVMQTLGYELAAVTAQ